MNGISLRLHWHVRIAARKDTGIRTACPKEEYFDTSVQPPIPINLVVASAKKTQNPARRGRLSNQNPRVPSEAKQR